MDSGAGYVTVTLVLPSTIAEELREITAAPLETAGVLLVSVVRAGDDDYRLLSREYHAVPESAYIRREEYALTIASHGYVPALARAEAISAAAIWVHTHPGAGASPEPSRHDHIVDTELADAFRIRSGSDVYGAIILSPRDGGLTFTGHMAPGDGPRLPISRMWVVGDRFRLTHADGLEVKEPLAMFDRNVRAFGNAIQSTLNDLRIGIVGCGGTGSAVAEQLVRLGVRDFVLIDPDRVSTSNLTRIYGSTPADIGAAKVDVASRHIRAIAPDARCDAIQSMLTVASAAKRLLACDIVFGCTDDNAGRLILSRIPTYLLTPVIDCGVLLSSSTQGELIGIDARVTLVAPEHACLLCRGRIDVARAGAELMTPTERKRLEIEGYAPALGQTEPAVVTYTTFVAAAAVSELLERLIGYGPDPRPSEVLLRCHEREISTNIAHPRPGHYCNRGSGKLARGMTDPFLELAWGT